jgi:hypothetical protein
VSSYREVTTFGSFVIEGQASGPFEVDTRPSNELGAFDDAASTSLAAGATFVTASATQSSLWEPARFAFDAAFQCQAGLDPLDVFAEGFGDAVATVHFQVDEPTTVSLAGHMTAAGNGASTVVLETQDGTVLRRFEAREGEMPLDESVVLTPGIFVLRLVTGGYGREFPGSGPSPASGAITATATFTTSTSVVMTPLVSPAAVTMFPNPLRGAGVIEIGDLVPLETSVQIFDARGRRVRDLGPSPSRVRAWDAVDDTGTRLAPGVYFLRAGHAPAVRVTILR